MKIGNRRLMWHGILLFLLGLVTGLAEQRFTNPRMGLAAHLEGVMNGTFLIAPAVRGGTSVGRVASVAGMPARSSDAVNAGHFRGAATKPEPGAAATLRAGRIWPDGFGTRFDVHEDVTDCLSHDNIWATSREFHPGLPSTIWTEVRLPPLAKGTAYWTALYGTYANWVFTTLAAVSEQRLPIHFGSGLPWQPWQESLAGAGFLSVSVLIIISVVLVLWGLRGGTSIQGPR
jgi:hypothetical protein